MRKLTAFLAAVVLGAALAPGAASAHIPDVSSTCSQLTVSLRAYQGPADNNEVKITIGGAPQAHPFGRSFEQTFPLDPTIQNTWVVEIDANINQGDPDRYDRVFEGSEYPCPTATTTTTSSPTSTLPASTSPPTTEPATTSTAATTTSTSMTPTTSSSPPSTSSPSAPTSPPSSGPASSAPSSTTSVPVTSGPTTTLPGLPVTGSTTQTTAGAALITLAAGALLVLIARRRSVA